MNRMHRGRCSFVLAIAMLVIGGLMPTGCAERKPAPTLSPRQVQSDSDRFFENMKQEERERGAASETKEAGDTGY